MLLLLTLCIQLPLLLLLILILLLLLFLLLMILMLLMLRMFNHLLLSLKLSIDIMIYWNSVIHVDFTSGSIDVEFKIYDYTIVSLPVALVTVIQLQLYHSSQLLIPRGQPNTTAIHAPVVLQICKYPYSFDPLTNCGEEGRARHIPH